MGQVAKALHHWFPKTLREVLKENFATDSRVFAELGIQLAGVKTRVVERVAAAEATLAEQI